MTTLPASPIAQGRLAALFVPGTRPERFEKALGAGADAVIIDLEDAVGVAEKADARAAVAGGFPKAGAVLLRINGCGTPWHGDDLALARSVLGRSLPLAGVVLPKAEGRADVEEVAAALGGAIPIVALIESARGLAEARCIAASPAVARLAFGSIDFAADLGCAHTRAALLTARSELVLAARLAGQAGPVDGVTANVADDGVTRDDAAYAAELGFSGKLLIHPRQVAPALAGFAPSAEEVAWAERIVASISQGGAVVKVDGAMVDAPVLARARQILARAGAAK